MVRDGVIGFLRDTLSNNSGNLNRGKNKPNGYEPLAQFANQISQNLSTAEEKTVSALAATEPTDQLGRVLQQIAILIRGGNDGVPDIRGRELEIAQAVFAARKLILDAEKSVLKIAKSLPEEAPIRQIAEGRQSATSLQEAISPPLKSPDTLTPEDVVRIGKDSLARAGREIKNALMSLEPAVEPGEIPPILRALAKAINPRREPVINEKNNYDKAYLKRLPNEEYDKIRSSEVDPITSLTRGAAEEK